MGSILLPSAGSTVSLLRVLTSALSLVGTECPQRGERASPSHGSLYARGPFDAGRQPKALTDKSAAHYNSSADRHNARSSGETLKLVHSTTTFLARL